MSNEAAGLQELIEKPYALKVGKSVVLDKILTRLHGSPDGKVKAMTLQKACADAGTTYAEIQQWMKDDVELRDRWQLAIDTAKDTARLKARDNAYKAINGELELNDKELADYSLKFLQLTDEEFNPAQRMDVRSASVNFEVSSDQLRAELAKLIPQQP
jgi:hypothetical protein